MTLFIFTNLLERILFSLCNYNQPDMLPIEFKANSICIHGYMKAIEGDENFIDPECDDSETFELIVDFNKKTFEVRDMDKSADLETFTMENYRIFCEKYDKWLEDNIEEINNDSNYDF